MTAAWHFTKSRPPPPPMDSLRKRVLAYDRLRNSPRQMEVTAGSIEVKRICMSCRRVPEEAAYAEWRKKWEELKSPVERDALPWWRVPPGDACQYCSGRLVEVVW